MGTYSVNFSLQPGVLALPRPCDVALREDALTLLCSLPSWCTPLDLVVDPAAGGFTVMHTLVTSASRPPIPPAAIENILKRKCAGAVNPDTVVDLLSPTLESFRTTRRSPERHSGHK